MKTEPLIVQEGLEVHKLVVGPIDNNVYVVRCSDTGESLLVDAANEHQRLIDIADELNVKTIVETHGHWDHIGAVEELRQRGYSVGVASEDSNMLASYDYLIEDGELIAIGKLRIRAIKTPGHTPGSTCFSIDGHKIVLSGDTLFPGGPGATHFEGGSFSTIINSIDTKLFAAFNADTLVLPGHGTSTTIGSESYKLPVWIERGW